jgi:7,8-dihydropterin-6-yl-methyl-4-(beta-D-ribofuranosyl)aminobenzene 5'-phosphate synthase
MLSEPHKKIIDRRDVLCGGGAFAFGILVASLLRGSKPVCAQPIASAVPEVDRVAVRVVTDSYQFAVVAGKKTGDVDVQHFGWGLSVAKPPDRTLRSWRRNSKPSHGFRLHGWSA